MTSRRSELVPFDEDATVVPGSSVSRDAHPLGGGMTLLDVRARVRQVPVTSYPSFTQADFDRFIDVEDFEAFKARATAMGIPVGQCDVRIRIDGKLRLMDTTKKDFGTLKK
ncbi:MAG: hypothetical protein V1760_02950 [Candidatus Peregrinibacteria bacterium]